jgi:hypothetical protein
MGVGGAAREVAKGMRDGMKFLAGNLISIFLIKKCNLLISRPP